jgi:transcriptional regulator with XRE-family HTH domain
MADLSHVTILRDAAGAEQHAILPWSAFQALLQVGGTPPSRSLPEHVRRATSEGVHPVRAWRDHRGFNQAQLAALVGISRAYLAQIEGGERTGTLEVTARIARALGCLIDDLVGQGPDDFAGMVAGLQAMSAKLKDIAAQIPRSAWRTRASNGGFSLVEHVCHLRDIDGDGYRVRLDRMLTEERPNLHDIDGDALAKESNYQNQDLTDALAAFTTTRWAIVARLAKLTPEERQRSGIMAGKQITIEGLAAAMQAHDSEHLDQLAELQTELVGRS